jgi:hypothetical protein
MRCARTLLLPVFALIGIAACSSGDPEQATSMPQRDDIALTSNSAARLARLALDCIHKEYPNKLSQVLKNETELLPPKTLHPAFYGCFDWHSSVHGHWMLVKLLKEFPDLPVTEEIVAGLEASITPAKIAGEIRYLANASASWERTYGWAWLLQLATELTQWDDPRGKKWADALEPLARAIRDRYIEFLPRQEYPIRTGVHPNTAFGLSFAFDYAKAASDSELEAAIASAATLYFANDVDCPLSWEPSGEDFLSPCLEEAALMARIMANNEYKAWLAAFLPTLTDSDFLVPANVSDRSDPKIVHLDGLNLSRAWNLYVIADEVGDHALARQLRETAASHLAASLPHITSEHYEGSHWLGSFAVYALTRGR